MKSAFRIIIVAFLSLALLPALASCGNPSADARKAEKEMKQSLETLLGAELAAQVSEAWEPTLVDVAKLEAAISDRDFARYHESMLSLRVTYAKGVDDTIRLLDTSADQGWRRRMLSEVAAAEEQGGAEERGRAEGSGAVEVFPSLPTESEETKAWLRGQYVEHPREAGELMRVAFEMQAEITRLGVYIATAVGAEGVKSLGEAYEGFMKPSQPRKPSN